MGNCLASEKSSNNNALKSRQKQGAKELKENWVIDNNTKVLGQGSFGKVFLTHNKNKQDF